MLIEIYILLIIVGFTLGLIGFFSKNGFFQVFAFIIFAVLSLASLDGIEKTYCEPLQNSTSNLTDKVQCSSYSFRYSYLTWFWAGISATFLLTALWDTIKTLIYIRRRA